MCENFFLESCKQWIIQNKLVVLEVKKPNTYKLKQNFDKIDYSDQLENSDDHAQYSKQKDIIKGQLLK